MNTAALNLTDLSTAEMQLVDGGVEPITTGAALAFIGGAVIGAAVVIGGAYLIYRAVS